MKVFALLATISVAAAQSSNAACSSSNPVAIQNQGDTSVLQGCTTFTGDVVIEKQTLGTISLSGVRAITGDLTIDGAVNLTSIGADSLQQIGGKLLMNDLQRLTSASFPQLVQVGDLVLTGLPNLSQLNFDRNLRAAKTVSIQNTFLGSLSGLALQSVNAMTIANNRMLQSAKFEVSTISGSVIVQANGDKFEIAFPKLQSAQNITIRTASSISIPALVNVTGNLGFYENTFATLEAANLTSIGQTLAINGHTNLNNVSMPLLRTIGGGFQVQNNTKLETVDFPSVIAIGGAFDFYGAFNNVTLPALKDIRGGFNLQSSGNVECKPFEDVRGSNKVIKGAFKCANGLTNPGNAATDPKASGNKKGAGSFNSIPSYLVVAAGAVAGVMSLM